MELLFSLDPFVNTWSQCLGLAVLFAIIAPLLLPNVQLPPSGFSEVDFYFKWPGAFALFLW